MKSTVLEKVQSGSVPHGWAVFHFKPLTTLIAVAWQLFSIAAFGGAAYMFLWMPVTDERTQENIYFGYGACLVGVLFCIALLFSLKRLIAAKKSMIVITDDTVVRAFSGSVHEYEIKNMTRLRLIQLSGSAAFMPRYEIEFQDKASGRIEVLAQKRYFGDENAIFNILNSKCI